MKNPDPISPWKPFQSSQARPWSNVLAAHLLRRAGFGGTITEIEAAQKAGLDATLDKLFSTESAASYNEDMAMTGRLVSGSTNSRSLAAWWFRSLQRQAESDEARGLLT